MAVDPDSRKMIGILIRRARIEAGFLQQQKFADALSIRQNRISDWERGRFSPNRDNLAKIARATKKPIEFFLTVTNPTPLSSDKGTEARRDGTGSQDQTRVLELESQNRELKADVDALQRILDQVSSITGRATTRQKARQTPHRTPKHRRRN